MPGPGNLPWLGDAGTGNLGSLGPGEGTGNLLALS